MGDLDKLITALTEPVKDRTGHTYTPLARYCKGKQTAEAKVIHARCRFPRNDPRYSESRTLTKIRALVRTYEAMARELSASGAGSKEHRTIKDMIRSNCPHFEAFDEIGLARHLWLSW